MSTTWCVTLPAARAVVADETAFTCSCVLTHSAALWVCAEPVCSGGVLPGFVLSRNRVCAESLFGIAAQCSDQMGEVGTVHLQIFENLGAAKRDAIKRLPSRHLDKMGTCLSKFLPRERNGVARRGTVSRRRENYGRPMPPGPSVAQAPTIRR